jgi:tetratricopeptide (TPR) repeat protein
MILTLEDKNYTEAETTLRQALTLAETAGNLRLVAQAHNYFGGFAHSARGDYRAERDHRQKAAEAYRQMGAASHELNSLSVTAFCSMLLGEFAFAEAALPRLHDLLRVIPGLSEVEWVALTVEIPLLRYQGEWNQAINRLLAYQAQARQRNDPNTLGTVDLALGEIFLEQAEWSRAEEVLLEANDCWKPSGYGTTWPLCLLSRVRARQGRIEEAWRLFAEAREQAGPQPISGDELRLPLALAQVLVAESNWPEAWAAFETAVQIQTQRGLRWDHAQTLREWAEAHVSRNGPDDIERARELLYEAQIEFEGMNVPIYASLVRERLKSL